MTTVADLYQQLLGRAPDAGGLAYWTQQFGDTVDPTELATFRSVAQQTEPMGIAPTAAPAPSAADVAMPTQVDKVGSYSSQFGPAAGMPTSVSDFYQKFYGTSDPAGEAYWKSQFGGDKITPQQAAMMIKEVGNYDPNINTGVTVDQAFKDYLGGNTDQAGLNYWKQQFGNGPLTTSQLAQLTNRQYNLMDEGGGGLLGTGIGPNVSLSDAAKVAALYYGGSAIADALGAGASTAGGFTGELPAGYTGYTAPTVTNLGTVAGSTEGIASGANGLGGLTATPGAGTSLYDAGANLSGMGGAQGLGGGNTLAGLANMGGAQGLTAGLAGGDILGAQGVGGVLTPAAAGLGTALGLSNAATSSGALSGLGAGIGAGIGSGGIGTLTGTPLGDAALISGGTGLLGAGLTANAAQNAANAQSAAAQAAAAQQQANFNLINKQQTPYRAAGSTALNNLGALGSGTYQMYDESGNPIGTGTGSGYLQHQFNAADLAAGLAPNYNFMLQQGQMANQRAANAAGGGLGGNALTGLNKFTQDYAGNAYQNAFNNYQAQRQNIYNTLAGIAGIGQTGQTATNTAATNAVNAATQLGVGSAAAQAAGTTGAANAYGNALSNVGNNITLASLLNQRGNVATPLG